MHPTTQRLFDALKIAAGVDGHEEVGQVARFLGESAAVITNWKTRGVSKPGKLKAHKLARVNPDWIDTGVGPMLTSSQPAPANVTNIGPAAVGAHRIPLISAVQAGVWTGVADPYAVGDGSEFLLTDLDLSENAFALEIKGDSMLPEFRPGDRVIIDPAVAPQPGDFVVAKNGDEEATFKKYRPRSVSERGDIVFELVPLNDDYPSMRSDVTPIRIVGTMVEHRKYRRRT